MVSNDFIFYLLSTARTSHGTITSKWKCRIFFRLWFDQHIGIECITGGEETSYHRVFGYPHNQSKFAANYTYHVDTSRHFVYFEVNYVRVTPRQRSSFQISDWLVWQLRDCVRVFFHVECMGIKCKVEKLLARANKLPLKMLEWLFKIQWTTLKNT